MNENDYYEASQGVFNPYASARAEDVVAEHNAIQAGFAKLPSPDKLKADSGNYLVAGGSANTITATLDPALGEYGDGLCIKLKVATGNTGPATLNLNSLGAIPIVDKDGAALRTGAMSAGHVAYLVYVAGSFRLLNDGAGNVAADWYIGKSASNPTTDGDGNPLTEGLIYWNTAVPEMRVYNGSDWVAAYTAAGSYAALNSPEFTGTPLAPTAAKGTNTTQLATTAFVMAALNGYFQITDAAGFEIDPDNGHIQYVTLGANRTPKATQFENGQSVVLHVDDGTAYTLTWSDTTFGPSGVKWIGTVPTLPTTGWGVIILWKFGGQVYGKYAGATT